MRSIRLVSALAALTLLSAAPAPVAAPLYWTSNTPGGQNKDQLNIEISNGSGNITIDKVQVWNGTGQEPTGTGWDDAGNANITEYPQTANNPPKAGEWKNVGTQALKPKLWFGNDIPENGKVRVCISYANEPAPSITPQNPEWSNHP
jgi:hypothetical protein